MTTKPTAIIGLYNPKSPTNVGAVLRAAGCYDAAQVRYNGTRYSRAVKFQTDTQNSQERIQLVEMEDLTANVADDVEIVCVELVVGATARCRTSLTQRTRFMCLDQKTAHCRKRWSIRRITWCTYRLTVV